MFFVLRFKLLLFLDGSSSRTHGLSSIAASGSRVGLRALATTWQPTHVANTPVRFDIFQSLDVTGNGTLEVTFNLVGFNDFSDSVFLVNRKFFGTFGYRHFGFFQNFQGARTANTIEAR